MLGSTRRRSMCGASRPGSVTPMDAMICKALATVASWKRRTRAVLSGTFRARARRGSWVVTPVGHLFVWHFWAWMQPTANIIARAELP